MNYNKFKQLKEEVASPNVFRTAAGAPGHEYYQNEADYVMSITLNDQQQKITGSETIKYNNKHQKCFQKILKYVINNYFIH